MTIAPDQVSPETAFALGNAFSAGSYRFQAVDRPLDWRGLLLGRSSPTTAVRFSWEAGRTLRDLMGETYGGLLLVSEQFVNALVEERARGWATFPISLLDRTGLPLDKHYGIAITGRAGPIDHARSRIEPDFPRAPGGVTTFLAKGLYFEPNSWDGSDLFIPEGSTTVCAVRRIATAMKRRRLSNIRWTQLTEFSLQRFADRPSC